MMSEKPNRREFFRSGTALSLGAAAALMQVQTSSADTKPIIRNGIPKFKFSLAAYSYRDLLKGDSAPLTLSDFIEECAKMQLEGTELTSYYFPQPITDDYLRRLKTEAFRLGLDVSGTAVGNDFGFPPGPKRDSQISEVKQWIEHAEKLGAPVIRIFAGKLKNGTTEAESHRLMVTAMEECCDYAHQHGVILALENHGGPTSTADGILRFVRDVSSPAFGVNLDTGNFHTGDVYGDLAKIAPHAVNVQVKVVIKRDGKQEPMDFHRVAQMMRDVGYRGYIVLEYEESEDPREQCPKYVDMMREAFA